MKIEINADNITFYTDTGEMFYMDRLTLEKANIIDERIRNLKRMKSAFLSKNRINISERGGLENSYFPASYEINSKNYEFIRSIIVTAIEAKIKESEEELKAL